MKNEFELKIHLLDHTILATEWTSLLGDKYRYALDFNWSLVDNIQDANVLAWDGILTAKNHQMMKKMLETVKEEKKILLLQREAQTLFEGHPFVKFISTTNLNVVEVDSGNILPEDLLRALETCFRKLSHV